LLSLPLVPARDRRVVRAQCDDRSGPGERAQGRGRSRRHALEQRQGAEDCAVQSAESRCGATTPERATPCALFASVPSMTQTGFRRTFTFSRRRSSHGSCFRRTCLRWKSITSAPSTGRKKVSSAAARCWRQSLVNSLRRTLVSGLAGQGVKKWMREGIRPILKARIRRRTQLGARDSRRLPRRWHLVSVQATRGHA
jgi:hypothetical protein